MLLGDEKSALALLVVENVTIHRGKLCFPLATKESWEFLFATKRNACISFFVTIEILNFGYHRQHHRLSFCFTEKKLAEGILDSRL